MEAIYLPSITGQFGNWRYYQVVISVKHLVELMGYSAEKKPIYRFKTVDEVSEIYSSNINEMLQRVFDSARLQPIQNYLLKQSDKYINNLTIAIFGGNPEWLPIGLENTNSDIEDIEGLKDVYKAFGLIKLSGNETLFVLDGQHRIMGLREGVKQDVTLAKQEIAVTLISHEPTVNGKKRTRRLFTTINRHAKPVSLGESILLDEDDMSAIIARKLIEDFPLFKGKDVIALEKTANLNLPRDEKKFSTVITIWNINESLIDAKEAYPIYVGPKKNLVKVRPKEDIIEANTKMIFAYWKKFFEIFPAAKKFILKPTSEARYNGGPFSLRPIGQDIYCDVYIRSLKDSEVQIEDLKKIPDDLNNKFWHYVLWNPTSKTITGTKAYARSFIYYHLGYSLTVKELAYLKENYKKFHNKESAILPKKLFVKKSVN